MIDLKEKDKCCGCTACYHVCPKRAISMKADREGFSYPSVNKNLCVNCGKCEKVCPIVHKKAPDVDRPLEAYVVRNNDNNVLQNSASGGFFSALAKFVVSMNGYAYGAVYDENLIVRHWGTQDENMIFRFQSSKYVQSDLGDTFEEVQKHLENGDLVCFSGTPCQIEGLKNSLNKEYKNLITVDLVCHGVPSPMLWREYIKSQNDRFKGDIVTANFRNKDYGYQNSTLKLSFSNGKTHHGSSRNDAMMRCFFGEISSRPSCYNCSFKFAKHESDFTIFDAWHGAQLINRFDDNRGYTHLFIQSEKGMRLIEQLSDVLEMERINAEDAISLDGPMVRHSAKPHKARQYFLNDVAEYGIDEAVEKHMPISRKDIVLASTKGILFKLGILKKMQNLSKKLNI